MKKLLLSICLIIQSTALVAQYSFSLNRSFSGNNLHFGFDFYRSNNVLTIGVKSLLNSRNYYSQREFAFKHQMYALDFAESLGLFITYKRTVSKEYNLSVYGELQLSYLRVRNYFFQAQFQQVNNGLTSVTAAHIISSRKFNSDFAIGISYLNNFGKLFDLEMRTGVGLFFINDYFEPNYDKYTGTLVYSGAGKKFDWFSLNGAVILHYIPKKIREKR